MTTPILRESVLAPNPTQVEPSSPLPVREGGGEGRGAGGEGSGGGGYRTFTPIVPLSLVARIAGLYIASTCTGGSRNCPGATARTSV